MKTANKEKIVIVEDQEMFSEGLRLIINSTELFEVAEIFRSRQELANYLLDMNYLLYNSCRIILLDLNLNGEDGLPICREVKQKHPKMKVVILTGYGTKEIIDKARKAGADGFVTKDMSSRLLADGLERILNGQNKDFVIISNSESEAFSSPLFKDEFVLRYRLTPRELEVMSLMLDGNDPYEITKKLFISYDTFKTHRNHIYSKLGVSNVTGLVKFAIRNDLISS